MNIDLHIHTSYSDGDNSVKEVLKLINKNNIDLFCITDHDSVQAYDDLKNTHTGKSKYIYGVELTSNYNNEIRDILGYGINVEKMNELLKSFASKEHGIKREQDLLEEYTHIFKRNGIEFNCDNFKIKTGRKGEAYLQIFEEIGKIKENYEKFPALNNPSKFFWDNCIERSSSFYINEAKYYTPMKEAIDTIHKAGGKAFFAHPCIHYMSYEDITKMLDEARQYGLDGVEVMHAKHSIKDIAFLEEYANKHNVYKSGGSDYHGSPKPDIKILTGKGNLKVSYSMIEEWVNKLI